MNIKRLSRSDVSKVLGTATLGVAMLALGQRASAQYTSNFNAPTYTAGESVSDTDGWISNDEYTGATYSGDGNGTREIGQSDVVGTSTTYSSSSGDSLAELGGFLNQNNGALPGVNTEYLSHGTNAPAGATTFSFGVDFVVSPTGSSIQSNHDTFGFYIGNPVNASSAGFSINFEPTGRVSGATPSTTADNVSFTSNGTLANPVGSITLGSRYRLSITGTFAANATGTFTAQIMSETNTGGIAANPNTFTVVSNQTFAGSISEVSALWKLTDTTDLHGATTVGPNPTTGNTIDDTNTTARTGGGANTLYFDNLAFAVPEPSSYALLGAGMLGLVSMIRRRQHRRA